MAVALRWALTPVLHVVRWFDSWAPSHKRYDPSRARKIRWIHSAPFLAMHLACFAVIWVGVSPVAVAVAIGLYLFRMLALAAFYHRYFSHRTYKTTRVGQFIFAVLGATCVQRGPLWWAAHHRHHHKHSDQERDEHSPATRGFWRAHMTWVMLRENHATKRRYVQDLAKYPELVFLDRFDTLVPIALAGGLYALGAHLGATAPELGTSGPQMLVWGFFISTVFLFHATGTINSLSHLFGKRPYKTRDTSRNNVWLALLTMGEGWHNNHHYYQSSVRQGFRWWQVDVAYYMLRFLSFFRIVWDLRPVPSHVIRAAEPTRSK